MPQPVQVSRASVKRVRQVCKGGEVVTVHRAWQQVLQASWLGPRKIFTLPILARLSRGRTDPAPHSIGRSARPASVPNLLEIAENGHETY